MNVELASPQSLTNLLHLLAQVQQKVMFSPKKSLVLIVIYVFFFFLKEYNDSLQWSSNNNDIEEELEGTIWSKQHF